MTLDLQTSLFRKERFTLLPAAIRVEGKWALLHHSDEFRYEKLVSRSTKVRKSLGAAFFVFLVLAVIPVGFGWFAVFLSAPVFHVGTVLFSIPALIGLREVWRSFRQELVFLEKGDGGVAFRFSYSNKEEAAVAPFIQELKKRISNAKKK